MMGPSILHRLFKIFNMKIYFTIVSFLIVYTLNAQAVLPHALLINNNAYPSTITANTAFNFESEIVSELRNVHKWSGNVHVPLPIKPRVYSV